MKTEKTIMITEKTISWFARVSLFIVFFWFGFLKIIKVSPAEELVRSLYNVTISNYFDFPFVLLMLGIFECFIAIIWLVPFLTRIALYSYSIHLILTILPLILLIEISWQDLFTLTLVGQYIMKNLCMLSVALSAYYYYNNVSRKQIKI
ncbi:MAG: hypothetical protein CMC54_00010 [Flavobacteriaceae bacterium]|nr:hypothetical protein [Flavobacteriaceae bacterium]|tara:strand:- start:3914 stop:4360 length:447 start_codon:yes stop_codon:yes gene_type:complete